MAGESARDRANRARAKAERLARYAENWEKGAEGESHTASEFGRLGPGWICWHDLRWPGRRFANIDHLAIGPAGIFVVDSKNWSGRLEVKNGVLRQNGYQREPAVAGCADSALAVGELAPEYLHAVKPVLCFVRDESIEGWARDVMICSTANLIDMLTSRPRLFSDAEVAQVAGVLSRRLTTAMPSSGAAPSAGRRPRASDPARSSPTSAPAATITPTATNPKKRLPRFFVGLGIWFCFMVVAGAILGAFPAYADSVITPAALVAGLVSWFLARRIVR